MRKEHEAFLGGRLPISCSGIGMVDGSVTKAFKYSSRFSDGMVFFKVGCAFREMSKKA